MTGTRRALLRAAGALLASAPLTGCVSDENAGADGTRTKRRTTEPTVRTTDPTARATAGPTDTHTGSTPSPDTPPEPPETDAPTETPTESSTATDTPASTPAGTTATDYTDWLPLPSALGRDHYAFQSVSIEAVQEHESHLGGAATDVLTEYPVPGVESTADATHIHQIHEVGTVTQGPFDRESIETAFAHAGHSTDGSRHGFTVFEGDDAISAVGDGVIVTSGMPVGGDDPRPAVESILDAGVGSAPRYPDANEVCGSLVEAIGPATVVAAHTHESGVTVDGAVGGGLAYYVAPAETEIHAPVVFEPGTTDEDAVADWADGAAVFRDQVPETSVSGRRVTAKASAATGDVERFRSEFPGQSATSGPTRPQVLFGFDYDSGDGRTRGTLEIRHEGGDTIDGERLFVRGTGFADVDGADQTEPGAWAGTVSDDGTVAAGNTVVVGAESDFEISVVYENPGEAASSVLAEQSGPDA